MSNINNQTKDIYGIAEVQELSNETAATCCGGELIVWDGKNFTRDSLVLSGGVKDLKSFNNRASSLKITGDKIWVLYTGKNFTGNKLRVQGAQFKDLSLFEFNNNIESLRPLA